MKNEKQHRLLFIIPAVIIAIILIICIAVAVSSKSGEKGKKKDSRSVSVTENTQDIVAESETLELVKKDALKETNVVDKDNKQNNGTQSNCLHGLLLKPYSVFATKRIPIFQHCRRL